MTKLNWWNQQGDVELPEVKKNNKKTLTEKEIKTIVNNKSIHIFDKVLKIYWTYLNKKDYKTLQEIFTWINNIIKDYNNDINKLQDEYLSILYLWYNTLFWINIDFQKYEEQFLQYCNKRKYYHINEERLNKKDNLMITKDTKERKELEYNMWPSNLYNRWSTSFYLYYNKQNFDLYNNLINWNINTKHLLRDIISILWWSYIWFDYDNFWIKDENIEAINEKITFYCNKFLRENNLDSKYDNLIKIRFFKDLDSDWL